MLIIIVLPAVGFVVSFTAASDPFDRLIIRIAFLALSGILGFGVSALWRRYRD